MSYKKHILLPLLTKKIRLEMLPLLTKKIRLEKNNKIIRSIYFLKIISICFTSSYYTNTLQNRQIFKIFNYHKNKITILSGWILGYKYQYPWFHKIEILLKLLIQICPFVTLISIYMWKKIHIHLYVKEINQAQPSIVTLFDRNFVASKKI